LIFNLPYNKGLVELLSKRSNVAVNYFMNDAIVIVACRMGGGGGRDFGGGRGDFGGRDFGGSSGGRDFGGGRRDFGGRSGLVLSNETNV